MDRYKNYSIEQWLEDEDFIRWIKKGSSADHSVFTDLKLNFPEVAEKMQLAEKLLQKISQNERLLSEDEVAMIWHNVQQGKQIHNHKQGRNPKLFQLLKVGTVAASIFLVVGILAWLIISSRSEITLRTLALSMPVDSFQTITLQLPDKKFVTFPNRTELSLAEGNRIRVSTLTGEINWIQLKVSDLLQNSQLIVPDGNRASLILEDGSKITLHPGSKIVFPLKFAENERKVFLQGVAFLDVTKEVHHPFVVETALMNVNVLGTSFNVSANPSDSEHSVVLVEGLVEITTDGQRNAQIHPNERYTYYAEKQQHSIDKVDTDLYTSWKEGVLIFESSQLEMVLLQLESFYGVRFEFDSSILATIRISGKLDLNSSIEKAMKVLETVCPITTTYNGNTLKINVQP